MKSDFTIEELRVIYRQGEDTVVALILKNNVTTQAVEINEGK